MEAPENAKIFFKCNCKYILVMIVLFSGFDSCHFLNVVLWFSPTYNLIHLFHKPSASIVVISLEFILFYNIRSNVFLSLSNLCPIGFFFPSIMIFGFQTPFLISFIRLNQTSYLNTDITEAKTLKRRFARLFFTLFPFNIIIHICLISPPHGLITISLTYFPINRFARQKHLEILESSRRTRKLIELQKVLN